MKRPNVKPHLAFRRIPHPPGNGTPSTRTGTSVLCQPMRTPPSSLVVAAVFAPRSTAACKAGSAAMAVLEIRMAAAETSTDIDNSMMFFLPDVDNRYLQSEVNTPELQSIMRTSYAA